MIDQLVHRAVGRPRCEKNRVAGTESCGKIDLFLPILVGCLPTSIGKNRSIFTLFST